MSKAKVKPTRQFLKFVGPDGTEVLMLPAGGDRCETCNWIHRPELPHNRETIFYQMRFYYENGYRWPTWRDAMAHCSEDIKKAWAETLGKLGRPIDDPVPEPKQGTINVGIVPGVSVDVSVSIPHNSDATPADVQAAADKLETDGSEFIELLEKRSQK